MGTLPSDYDTTRATALMMDDIILLHERTTPDTNLESLEPTASPTDTTHLKTMEGSERTPYESLGRVVLMEQTSVEVETALSRSPYEPTMAMEETEDAVNDAPHLHSSAVAFPICNSKSCVGCSRPALNNNDRKIPSSTVALFSRFLL